VKTLREFFSEHAHNPRQMSLAVGLGLFFGIVPIWGVQMLVAATVAHWLRLNKVITLLASNISIPPFAPFIIGGAFILGHWMFTGEVLKLAPPSMTGPKTFEYIREWLVGSVALAVIVAVIGTILTYVCARLVKRK
jgi:uncharacterized protein (DUF2062 family)